MLREKVKKCLNFVFIAGLFTLLSFLPVSQAKATMYDDFNGENIDLSKWTKVGSDLFAQAAGTLNFAVSSDSFVSAILVSNQQFSGDFWVKIDFYDFQSTSTQVLKGNSGLGIHLGSPDNRVVVGYNVAGGGGFFSQWIAGPTSAYLYHEQLAVTGGMLALGYISGVVQAAYSTGHDPDDLDSWISLGDGINPGWTSASTLVTIYGQNANGHTEFKLDNLEYASVPVPPAMLLLGSGLVGVVGLRRSLRKS